jgi:hypothetical protein
MVSGIFHQYGDGDVVPDKVPWRCGSARLCERFVDSLGCGQNFAPPRSGVSVGGAAAARGPEENSCAMIDAAQQMMGIDQFQDRRQSAAPLRFRWPGARLFQRMRRRPTEDSWEEAI